MEIRHIALRKAKGFALQNGKVVDIEIPCEITGALNSQTIRCQDLAENLRTLAEWLEIGEMPDGLESFSLTKTYKDQPPLRYQVIA